MVVSCAAKTKLGMVTQNEGSASSRSKSHTVYIYINIYIQYTITYNNNIYIHIILSNLRAHHFEADLGIDLTHPSQTVVQSSQYRV